MRLRWFVVGAVALGLVAFGFSFFAPLRVMDVVDWVGSLREPSEDSLVDPLVGEHEVAKVVSVTAPDWLDVMGPLLAVHLEPTEWTTTGALYEVRLYEKGKYRNSYNLSWGGPELNMQAAKTVYFELTYEEHRAYSKLKPGTSEEYVRALLKRFVGEDTVEDVLSCYQDLGHIFSVRIETLLDQEE